MSAPVRSPPPGRMDKFFYKPDRETMLGVLGGIFSGEGGRDALPPADCAALLDAFPEQAGDCGFFMGLKSRVLDSAVRQSAPGRVELLRMAKAPRGLLVLFSSRL